MTLDDKQFVNMVNRIIDDRLQFIEDNVEEEHLLNGDVEETLTSGVKERIRRSLEDLWSLFDEYIDQEDCTVSKTLEFFPWFIVYGLMIGAQLGVSQDEAYMIVDYYLVRNDLIKD